MAPGNRASLSLGTKTTRRWQVDGRSLFAAENADGFIRIDHAGNAYFGLAFDVELNVGVHFLSGWIDVGCQERILARLVVGGIGIDDRFVAHRFHRGGVGRHALEDEIEDGQERAVEEHAGENGRQEHNHADADTLAVLDNHDRGGSGLGIVLARHGVSSSVAYPTVALLFWPITTDSAIKKRIGYIYPSRDR